MKDALTHYTSGLEDDVLDLRIMDVTGRSFYVMQLITTKGKSGCTLK